jgi:hypothetical protein
MNKNAIAKFIIGKIQIDLNRKITQSEFEFANDLTSKYLIKEYPNNIKSTLKRFLSYVTNEVNKLQADDSDESFDFHELFNKVIDPQNSDIERRDVVPSTPMIDINSIFGTNDIRDTLKMFNPRALYATSYIMLDRKYQSRNTDGVTEFNWNLSVSGYGLNEKNAISTNNTNNVVGIKIQPFRMPSNDLGLTFSNRISVGIKELSNHAYVSPIDLLRYHFIFTAAVDGLPANDSYTLSNVSTSTDSFWLHNPIQSINNITLTFANPNFKLTLDSDRGIMDTSAGALLLVPANPTEFTTTANHNLNTGDRVTITGFSTSLIADNTIVDQINIETGHIVTVTSVTTFTIPVNSVGMVGVIEVNPPAEIYFESKRFIIPIELTYVRDKPIRI